jgi:hypothetical protein
LCEQQLDVDHILSEPDNDVTSTEATSLIQQQQHTAEQCSASAEARHRLSALTTTLAAATTAAVTAAATAVHAGLCSAVPADNSISNADNTAAAAVSSNTTIAAAVEAKLEALRCELAASAEHRALLSAAAAEAAEQTALSLEQGLLTEELALSSDALLLAGELSSYSSALAAVLAKLDRLEGAGNGQAQAVEHEADVASDVVEAGADVQSAAAGA